MSLFASTSKYMDLFSLIFSIIQDYTTNLFSLQFFSDFLWSVLILPGEKTQM